jgi:hypothetical protein
MWLWLLSLSSSSSHQPLLSLRNCLFSFFPSFFFKKKNSNKREIQKVSEDVVRGSRTQIPNLTEKNREAETVLNSTQQCEQDPEMSESTHSLPPSHYSYDYSYSYPLSI